MPFRGSENGVGMTRSKRNWNERSDSKRWRSKEEYSFRLEGRELLHLNIV
jgi:hypothetical protein